MLLFFLSFSLVFTGDLFFKYLFLSALENNVYFLISDWLYLKNTLNTGIAFSIPVTGVILQILTLVGITFVSIYFIYFEKMKSSPVIQIGYGCILGGAMGNAVERIYLGYVHDFLGVKYFAVMNGADIMINIGVFLLICYYISQEFFLPDSKESSHKHGKTH